MEMGDDGKSGKRKGVQLGEEREKGEMEEDEE